MEKTQVKGHNFGHLVEQQAAENPVVNLLWLQFLSAHAYNV